jgi:hypothetical protein
METFFQGHLRLDWGFDNPNKTAALIAMLMIAVWGLAYIRKYGFWIALVLFTALGGCLIHTFSRGGIIALFAGLLPVLWVAPRPWVKIKIFAVSLSIWAMIGVSIYLNAHERFGQGIAEEDKSITNRLKMWKHTPRMMVDAPAGWGLGNSGKAYMNWYQSLEDGEDYRTLVNSHLTWLVEFGWTGRFFYIFGWVLVFTLLFPSSNHLWHSILLGIWISFSVASWFSSIAEAQFLWILPVSALILRILARFISREWIGAKQWVFVGAISIVTTLTLFTLGFLSKGTAVKNFSGRIIVGGTAPKTWVVVDSKVTGMRYGKTIREFLKDKSQSIGVVERISDLSKTDKMKLVISGEISKEDGNKLKSFLPQSSKLVLLNPFFYPQEVSLKSEDKDKVEVLFGEFCQSPAQSTWSQHFQIQRVKGVGDYLPKWTDKVFENKGSHE